MFVRSFCFGASGASKLPRRASFFPQGACGAPKMSSKAPAAPQNFLRGRLRRPKSFLNFPQKFSSIPPDNPTKKKKLYYALLGICILFHILRVNPLPPASKWCL